jgi:hypothetical protein
LAVIRSSRGSGTVATHQILFATNQRLQANSETYDLYRFGFATEFVVATVSLYQQTKSPAGRKRTSGFTAVF